MGGGGGGGGGERDTAEHRQQRARTGASLASSYRSRALLGPSPPFAQALPPSWSARAPAAPSGWGLGPGASSSPYPFSVGCRRLLAGTRKTPKAKNKMNKDNSRQRRTRVCTRQRVGTPHGQIGRCAKHVARVHAPTTTNDQGKGHACARPHGLHPLVPPIAQRAASRAFKWAACGGLCVRACGAARGGGSHAPGIVKLPRERGAPPL